MVRVLCRSTSPACTNWDDLVWAGAKCAVDVMVETEIRETMVKNFVELPPQYWNTPQSLSKVFQEISGRGGALSQETESPYHVIQRHVILDDWPGLCDVMTSWLSDSTDPHLLRLLAHLVLVHRRLEGGGGGSAAPLHKLPHGQQQVITTIFWNS